MNNYSYLLSVKAWKGILRNFFIWMIPGVFVLAGFLLILVISLMASDGSLFEIKLPLPKGIYSFMAIALLMIAPVCIPLLLLLHIHDIQDYIFMIFFTSTSLFFGIWYLRKELKRLS